MCICRYNYGVIKIKYQYLIQNRLEIPFVKTVFASRAFSVAAPQIWNKLPDYIKSSDTISKFGKQLKILLFGQAYPAA